MWVLLLIVVAIGLFIIEVNSIKYIFKGISYSMKPSCGMAEIDEEFQLETTIINAKRLPVVSLRLSEDMPYDIKFGNIKHKLEGNVRKTFLSDSYIFPRQKLVRTTKVSLPRRGRFVFHGATLSIPSFLGLRTEHKNFTIFNEIVLPPRYIQSLELEKVLGSYMGEISVRRFILEDPVLTVGFRDYSGNEPMRSISWSKTATAGKIMVKNYDYTLDLSVTVILNTQSSRQTSNDENAAELEALFSLTRTVCDFLEKAETPYRFVTNAVSYGGAMRKAEFPAGLGEGHRNLIFRFLAEAGYRHNEEFDEMIAKTVMTAEQGKSHILLTPDVPSSVSEMLRQLRAKTGQDVAVITPSEWVNDGFSPDLTSDSAEGGAQ
jgi:uncharacterized protein (DUF58 family)